MRKYDIKNVKFIFFLIHENQYGSLTS